jgi:hypothetical protein
VPLDATVTTVRQAVDSTDPAIVIAADGFSDKKITLPVEASDNTVTVEDVDTSGKPTSLTLGAPITFASLQTVFDGQRSVLVATSNGAPQQLDDLLNSLNAKPGAWATLDGRAVISVPGRERVIIPNPTDSGKKPAVAPRDDRSRWAWWVAGAIFGLAAISAVASLLLSRRESVAAHRVEARHAEGEPRRASRGVAPRRIMLGANGVAALVFATGSAWFGDHRQAPSRVSGLSTANSYGAKVMSATTRGLGN